MICRLIIAGGHLTTESTRRATESTKPSRPSARSLRLGGESFFHTIQSQNYICLRPSFIVELHQSPHHKRRSSHVSRITLCGLLIVSFVSAPLAQTRNQMSASNSSAARNTGARPTVAEAERFITDAEKKLFTLNLK